MNELQYQILLAAKEKRSHEYMYNILSNKSHLATVFFNSDRERVIRELKGGQFILDDSTHVWLSEEGERMLNYEEERRKEEIKRFEFSHKDIHIGDNYNNVGQVMKAEGQSSLRVEDNNLDISTQRITKQHTKKSMSLFEKLAALATILAVIITVMIYFKVWPFLR